jgi:hypothetical protein
MIRRDWYPSLTQSRYDRPEAGQVIAYRHAVWKVTQVKDVPLGDDDKELWLKRGMPDLETWRGRPYKVSVGWLGGAKPSWFDEVGEIKTGSVVIAAEAYMTWYVYDDGRWPQCSCCGEPMPCRAALEDEQVNSSLDRVAKLEAIPPGVCWACSEPITTRQKSVTYPGDNIDLPGGQEPSFHTRQQCRGSAERYERKWIAADPRRERILTWPKCGGILVVHADGSSDCVSGRSPLGGDECVSQPDCEGHLTHDHGSIRACYVHEDYMRPSAWGEGRCPRGCDPASHHGTRMLSRPERREPSAGGLLQ